MVLIGLLVVAAVFVILGVVMASVGWLIASLVASLAAAGLLIRTYLAMKQRRAAEGGPAKADRTAAGTSAAPPGSAAAAPVYRPSAARTAGTIDPDVVVIDGMPDYHEADCPRLSGIEGTDAIPLSQALEDGFSACTRCTPPTELPAAPTTTAATAVVEPAPVVASAGRADVWVADGHPDYHEGGCTRLAGLESEAIPFDQAVEDGFVPCSVCEPKTAVPSAVPSAPAGAPTGERVSMTKAATAPLGQQVWVADGFPEYHMQACGELDGLESEAVPYEQALEDGFQPCVVCNPDAVFAAAAPAPQTAPAATGAPVSEVWVVDGFPEFHAEGCARLTGHDAEPIPFEQAVEDGFEPCTVCTPVAPAAVVPLEPALASVAAVAPPASSTTPAGKRQVLVVDGFPDYHDEGCVELVGLAGEPIPFDQALEDGFTPCPICQAQAAIVEAAAQPTVTPAVAPAATAQRADLPSADREVLVVDGFPDYHLAGCDELERLDAEPIPYDQAIEDGFEPCPTCRPELAGAMPPSAAEPTSAAGASPAAAAEPAVVEVFVVDGFPDYHRAGCTTRRARRRVDSARPGRRGRVPGVPRVHS